MYRKNDNDVTTCWHDVIVNFFDVVLFLLSSLVTCPSFMSISLLVLELWTFSFIRDWPEIWLSEIPSEFCPISGDWGDLRISNLTRMFLIKYIWMLRNASVIAFTVSWVIKGKPKWGGVQSLEPSSIRKEMVDINILIKSSNDRKIMQSIKITSRPPWRIRKWNHLSQFRWTSTKVIPIEKT